MSEDRHDYGRWLIIYLMVINTFLFLTLSFIVAFELKGADWNKGWIASRNNPEVVGKLEIAGAGDDTKQMNIGRGKPGKIGK